MKAIRTEDLKNVGQWIKTLRESRGMTIAELSKMTGVSNQALSYIEKNTQCRTDILVKILESLDETPTKQRLNIITPV